MAKRRDLHLALAALLFFGRFLPADRSAPVESCIVSDGSPTGPARGSYSETLLDRLRLGGTSLRQWVEAGGGWPPNCILMLSTWVFRPPFRK